MPFLHACQNRVIMIHMKCPDQFFLITLLKGSLSKMFMYYVYVFMCLCIYIIIRFFLTLKYQYWYRSQKCSIGQALINTRINYTVQPLRGLSAVKSKKSSYCLDITRPLSSLAVPQSLTLSYSLTVCVSLTHFTASSLTLSAPTKQNPDI